MRPALENARRNNPAMIRLEANANAADRMRQASVFMLYGYRILVIRANARPLGTIGVGYALNAATRKSCLYLAETALAIISDEILSRRPSTSTNAQHNKAATQQAQGDGGAARRRTPTVSGAFVAVRQGIGGIPAGLSPHHLVLCRVVFHRHLLCIRQLRGCHRRTAVPVARDLSGRSRLPSHDHSSALGPKRQKEARSTLSTVTPCPP